MSVPVNQVGMADGVAYNTAGLSGKLLYGSEEIACAFSKLWLKYPAETCRNQDQF